GIGHRTGQGSPARNVELDLYALDSRLSKRYGEADPGVHQDVVIRKVCDHPPVPVGVHTKLTEESFGQSGFEEISPRWWDRQPEHFIVQRGSGRRARKQQVLDS